MRLLIQLSNVSAHSWVQSIAASSHLLRRDISACRVQLTGCAGLEAQMNFSVIFSDASEHRRALNDINQQMPTVSSATLDVMHAGIPARKDQRGVRRAENAGGMGEAETIAERIAMSNTSTTVCHLRLCAGAAPRFAAEKTRCGVTYPSGHGVLGAHRCHPRHPGRRSDQTVRPCHGRRGPEHERRARRGVRVPGS